MSKNDPVASQVGNVESQFDSLVSLADPEVAEAGYASFTIDSTINVVNLEGVRESSGSQAEGGDGAFVDEVMCCSTVQ
jgi:hypothetical protein